MEQENDFEKKKGQIIKGYNNLTEYLKSKFGMNLDGFIKDSRYSRYSEDANFTRNVRNLVAHNADDYIIVTDKTIKRIEEFVNLITGSLESKMIPFEKLYTARMEDSVLPFLRKMQRENFSYLPIVDDNDVCVEVFSSYILMSYACLGKSIDVDTTFKDIYDAVKKSSIKKSYEYLPVTSPLVEVINTFKVTSDFHLDVVLVTKDGKAKSPLLGMITIWDLQ